MKIVLYSVSGIFGHRLWQEALRRGHTVSAVARAMARLTAQNQHRYVEEGNSLAPHRVARGVTGHDALHRRVGVLRRHPGCGPRYLRPRPVGGGVPPAY